MAQTAKGAVADTAVFRGVTHLALDAKGRLAIPSKHREVIARHAVGGQGGDPGAGTALILTADPSRCLLLYPAAAWEPIQERLMALSSFNEKTRALQRLLVGHAEEVDMDGTGRILVSPALRQYAALEHRAVLVGQGNKFEIWDESRWLEQTARAITFAGDELPPELTGFSL